MSLAVALSAHGKLWVSADTRAYSIENGPVNRPVDKLRIFHHSDRSILVCIAGESELAGAHLFEHTQNHLSDLFNCEGLKRFQAVLFKAIEDDIRMTPWNSEEERQNFISSVHITFLLAVSHAEVFVINATYDTSNLTRYAPPLPVLAFGMTSLVETHLKDIPNSMREWPRYLASLFETAAALSDRIAPPVDVARWSASDGGPSLHRFTLAALARVSGF